MKRERHVYFLFILPNFIDILYLFCLVILRFVLCVMKDLIQHTYGVSRGLKISREAVSHCWLSDFCHNTLYYAVFTVPHHGGGSSPSLCQQSPR